jgi:glucosyl-3-phosphoglycerate synthase
MVQPLAGIYGGRRSALEQLPFYAGHGVEIGMLFDMLDRFGLKAIAQVDLEEVAHRKQTITTLNRMSFAILQVFAEHLSQRGITGVPLGTERTMKILRADGPQFHLEELDVHEQKRQPMIEVKQYLGRHPLNRESGMLKRVNNQ